MEPTFGTRVEGLSGSERLFATSPPSARRSRLNEKALMAKISSKKARLIVVKIGTGVLTGSRGMIDRRQIDNIAQQIAQLKKLGFQVI